METPLEIKILGKTKFEKGKEFENFMQLVLQQLGYKKFMAPVHTTGMEFDIEAINNDGTENLLCECKAHESKIDTGDITNFYGKLSHQRSNNKNLKGYFFSTSGFTGTALKNYEELCTEDKKIFKIYDNSDIVKLLEKAGLFSNQGEIEDKIRSITDHELGKRYLVFHRSQLFVVQLIKLAGMDRNYVILTGNAEVVDKSIREEISKLDKTLSSLSEIDLALIKEVIIKMLDLEPKSAMQIAIFLKEKQGEIETILEELVVQGLVKKTDDKYEIVTSHEILRKILRRLDDKKFQLVGTKYLTTIINPDFITFVSYKFKINLDQIQKEELVTVCRLFPKVIDIMLNRPTNDFENLYNQMLTPNLSDDERRKRQEQTNKDLVARFLEIIHYTVAKEIENMSVDYFKLSGIRAGYRSSIIRIASDDSKLVDLPTTSTWYIARAGGNIPAGVYVTSDYVGVFGMAMACFHLEEYQTAISYFKKIDPQDEEYYVLACFNQGICYMRLSMFVEAIECFNKIVGRITANVININIEKCIQGLKDELTILDLEGEAINIRKRDIQSTLNRVEAS